MKLTTREEDYLETIFRLSEELGAVGISDVARERGVTLPTVVSAVTRLKRSGLVNKQHYGKIHLNPSGRKKAVEIYKKHTALKMFLTDILELPSKLAEQEACKMEHVMCPETIGKLVEFMEGVQGCPVRKSKIRKRRSAVMDGT